MTNTCQKPAADILLSSLKIKFKEDYVFHIFPYQRPSNEAYATLTYTYTRLQVSLMSYCPVKRIRGVVIFSSDLLDDTSIDLFWEISLSKCEK